MLKNTDKDRENRYKEKIELIEERLEDVEELLERFDEKFSKLACYKAFQEIVEGLLDIVAMLLKDKNKGVKDDYTNINKVEELGILSKEEASILREANGLRNRVIHKYNRTDDEIAKKSIINLLPNLEKILDALVSYYENKRRSD